MTEDNLHQDNGLQDGGVFDTADGDELWLDKNVPQGQVLPPQKKRKKKSFFARIFHRSAAAQPIAAPENRRSTAQAQGVNTPPVPHHGPPVHAAQEKPLPQHSRAAVLENVRRKKRARHLRMLAVIVLLGAAVLAYFTGVFGASLSVLGDVADSILVAFTPGSGWPQDFTLEGFTNAAEISGGFAAVGSSDLCIYSSTGKELRRVQHSYANPAIAVGKTRLCLYNRGGTQLTVESRSRTLYTYSTTSAIRQCVMADNGQLAVLTADEVLVLDTSHNVILRWTPSEKVSGLAFSPNGKKLAVACVQAENGYLGTVMYEVDIKGDQEYPAAVGTAQDGIALHIRYLSDNRLLAVYDSYAAVYDTSGVTTVATYGFGTRRLASVSGQDKNTVLLFGTRENEKTMQLVVLNANLQETAVVALGEYAGTACATRSEIYAVCTDGVRVYSAEGEYKGKQPLDTAPLAMLCADKPLLIMQNQVVAFALSKENMIEASA